MNQVFTALQSKILKIGVLENKDVTQLLLQVGVSLESLEINVSSPVQGYVPLGIPGKQAVSPFFKKFLDPRFRGDDTVLKKAEWSLA